MFDRLHASSREDDFFLSVSFDCFDQNARSFSKGLSSILAFIQLSQETIRHNLLVFFFFGGGGVILTLPLMQGSAGDSQVCGGQ